MDTDRIYKALHLFSGIGGGALGFQQACGEFGGRMGRFETLAGIDVDAWRSQNHEYICVNRRSPSRLCAKIRLLRRTSLG